MCCRLLPCCFPPLTVSHSNNVTRCTCTATGRYRTKRTTKSFPRAAPTPSKRCCTGLWPRPAMFWCRLPSPLSATITDTASTTIATSNPTHGGLDLFRPCTRCRRHAAISGAACGPRVTEELTLLLPLLTVAPTLPHQPSTSPVSRATTAPALRCQFG